jgi:demethylmenaquinone methyltransferase / 2-methoxy-6-polyprenyl-1,4-benzoquinol methylase
MRQKYPPVEEISDSERIGMVKDIFSTVTRRYDFLNHFLSLRRDVRWRRVTAEKMLFFKTNRLIDIATGTGDLAIAAARHHASIQVTGLDFVQEMMDVAREKLTKNGLAERVGFLRGDALDLPFGDGVFDVASMAFGIRNIPDRRRALEEMKRVVVSGGQIIVLEMTAPGTPYIRGLYRKYLVRVLPRLASIFSRNPAAYHYLADSILHFPAPAAFAREMEESGLVRVERFAFDLGITNLHIGHKPQS